MLCEGAVLNQNWYLGTPNLDMSRPTATGHGIVIGLLLMQHEGMTSLDLAGLVLLGNFQWLAKRSAAVCLDLQAFLHVQWLRFQRSSAHSLYKTSGTKKDKSLPRDA